MGCDVHMWVEVLRPEPARVDDLASSTMTWQKVEASIETDLGIAEHWGSHIADWLCAQLEATR